MKLILISLLLFNYLLAKEYSIIIDKKFNDVLFDITQDYDRGLTAIGFSKNYNTSTQQQRAYSNAFDYLKSLSTNNSTQMHQISLNSSAEITNNKTINISKISKAVSIIKTPSNGYYVGGYSDDGSLIVLKMSQTGDILFNKTFGTKNFDNMNDLISLRDGGVLAIGTSQTTRSKQDKLFNGGLGLSDIYLTRFTKNGVKIWSKKYGTHYDDNAISAVEANDGSLIVLSTTNYDNKKDITLMRISENGNKIWKKHYETTNLTVAHKIIKLRDNNFLISLSERNNMNIDQVKLVKFDIHQNILIEKIIETTYSSAIKDIKEYSNGRIIGVGYINDDYNTDALVMIFDNHLNMLVQEHYGDENYDIFNSVTILHNSQAAAAGVSTRDNSQESNMWIVKLNKDASIAQIPTKVVDFYKELNKIFKKEIDSRQLVIKEDLSIEFKSEELCFTTSEYKLTLQQKKFLDNFSKKLIPFLKANQEPISSLEVNGHTSSEWKGKNFTDSYLLNEKLSMNRAYSTLSHIFKTQDISTQKFLAKVIKGSGLNSSRKIQINKNENREKSRRVSFKIVLK